MELTCPPIGVSADNRLFRCSRRASPLELVGIELKIAILAIGGQFSGADNSFWLRKCRQLCLRPAVEALLLAHWNKLKSFDLAEPQLANLCSLMCGTKQQARTHDSYGLMDGADVRFEPAERARRWWNDIRSVAARQNMAPLLPAYTFARTIIAHPYPDGNGRLARALVHAALARTTDYSAPLLPLAPAFYMNAGKVAAALRELSGTGDWERFNATFTDVLAHAAELARRIHAIS